MKKHLFVTFLSLSLISPLATAYDAELAQRLHTEVSSKLDRKYLAEGGCKVSAADILKSLSNKEKVVLLDVRTPAEQQVVGLTHPNALSIPLDNLMLKENLDKLSQYKDSKIVVVCYSGERAALATGLLQAAGVPNVSFLGGGLIQLVTALTAKTAPMQ
jgi:rhodanese-related sulfurtransferase